jgi:YegS/Rv2252/BmrU family lipid kinase
VTSALVIGRRRKGRHIGQVVREVRSQLQAAGWKVECKTVVRKAQLQRSAEKAVRAGCGVIVAVGGDGAVGRVASGVVKTRAALGIIPTGTGNLLAGNLKIPHGTAKAVQTILTGRTKRIDIGRLNVDGEKHDFAVACGIGFDADVIEATGPGQKLRWGKLAYLANALGQTGSITNVPHEITLDGVVSTVDAAQVFIANFGKMLPMIQPRRAIKANDGLLDVIIVRASGPLPGLLATWEAMRQTELGESSGGHVFRAQAREVRIETQPSRVVEADGNALGRTPITASIRPRALRVIVPKK